MHSLARTLLGGALLPITLQMFRAVATLAVLFLLVGAGVSGGVRASDDADRILLFGGDENDVLIRPISARYMHAKEVRAYEKENPGLQK